jgi:hypothetical protein
MADDSSWMWLWRAVVQGVFLTLLVLVVGTLMTARLTEAMAPPTCSDTKDLVRLTPKRTTATSAHPTERDSHGRLLNYAPERVLDGDTATGWAEGVPGLGKGQALTFDFAPQVSPRLLCIVNGYAQSWALYTKNARVRTLAVLTPARPQSSQPSDRLMPAPTSVTTATTTEAAATRFATLSDAGTPDHVAVFQPVTLDLPATDRLELRIESVYSGTQVGRVDDTSLSEIEFWGPS